MKVLVFPYDKNPYQKLLYGAMKKQFPSKFKLRYVWFLPYVGALHIPFELMIRRMLGYKIIHIHWVAFFLNVPFPKRKQLSYQLTVFNIWWMKKLGYKIVWTVHDIVPHQPETKDDLAVSRYLSKQVDLKIVHSEFAIEQMKDKGLDVTDCSVIAHGNYDGVYEHTITRSGARKQLGIGSNKLVILFFGIVKTYKGVDDLLEAYVSARNKNTVLLIAGTCSDENLLSLINEASKEGDVLFFNEYIRSEDVATYFMAADLVCLPFKSITSSGSVILATTFGKPVIAPRKGALKELPATIGYLYSSTKQDGLTEALVEATGSGQDLERKSKASRAYADTLDWNGIAKRTYEKYEDLSG